MAHSILIVNEELDEAKDILDEFESCSRPPARTRRKTARLTPKERQQAIRGNDTETVLRRMELLTSLMKERLGR